MARTNAERQQRYRDKIAKQTLEETEKELDKMYKEACKWLDELCIFNELEFRCLHALLYVKTRRRLNEQEAAKALKLIDLTMTQATFPDWYYEGGYDTEGGNERA